MPLKHTKCGASLYGSSTYMQNDSFIETIKNHLNCESQTGITITAIDDLIIDFPTAFSPNGDALNDSFYPNTNQPIEITYFDIYNRLDQKVYSYTPRNPSWNGHYLGKPAPTGVYTYTMAYQLLYQKRTKTGEVMMVR